jgi:hypothetical protein
VLVFVGIAVTRGTLLGGRVMLLGKVSTKMIGTMSLFLFAKYIDCFVCEYVGAIRKKLYAKMLSQEVAWFDDPEHRPGKIINL